MSLARTAALLLTAACALPAQTPVVLINGYQLFCPTVGVSATFGAIVTFLDAIGIPASFYDTCSCDRCSIEEHSARLGQHIAQIGKPVDVIASSMGGLILRGYLAGKTTFASAFSPPLDPKARKAVFIATPNFGLVAPEIDARISQMQPGSQFLWDLATWNQNYDDLRGIDAIAIIGSGGTSGADDGLVPLTSASLTFAAEPERTRVIPYCHTDNIPFIVNCRSDAPPIGRIDSLSHPTLRIITSFLTGTSEWRNIGTTPSGNTFLASNGGFFVSARTSTNAVPNIIGVQATGQSDNTRFSLSNRANSIYYRTAAPAQTYALNFQGPDIEGTVSVPAGGSIARIAKSGPSIARAASSAAALPHLSLAPGMIVSLYGADLSVNSAATLSLDNAPAQIIYASESQVNAILPDSKTGLAQLTIQNSKGSDTLRVLLEPSVPTLFSASFTGTGPAAVRDAANGSLITQAEPASPGQIVAFYGTGLGATDRRSGLDYAITQPVVTIGGFPARIHFAGRAPGYPGLDQINVELPNVHGDSVPVTISSPARPGNTVTIAIR